MKTCTSCAAQKPLSEFYSDTSHKDGFASRCKKCCLEEKRIAHLRNPETKQAWRKQNLKRVEETSRIWREKNRDYINKYARNWRADNPAEYEQKVKNWRMKNPEKILAYNLRQYGLTTQEYRAMVEDQGGVCAICKLTNENNRRLSTDHDHKTGKVRGALCHACNKAIGLLKDSAERCESAAAYLRKFSEQSRAEVKQ